MQATCENCGTDIENLEAVEDEGHRFCSVECAYEYEGPESDDEDDDEDDYDGDEEDDDYDDEEE
jgi:MYM-type Zinc finger with FCS sequence motif